MSAVTAGDTPGLDIAALLQETFAIVLRNYRSYAPAVLLLAGLPRLVMGILDMGAHHSAFVGLLSVGAWLVIGVCGLILTGALIHNASTDLEGMHESFTTSLSASLNNFLVLLGSTVVCAICMGLGFLLLFVPGVMIAVAWSVAGPAVITEGRGVGASLQRSADLTRNRRWAVFGFLLILWVGVGIIESILVGVAGGAAAIKHNPLSVFLIQPLIAMVNTPLAAASCTALFHRLRALREGGAPEVLSDVFA